MAKVRLSVWFVVVGSVGVVLAHDVQWVVDDPAVMVMAVVRVVAAVLAAYLVLATLAVLIRVPMPSPAFVRRLVATAVGGGLLVTPIAAGAEPTPAAPAGLEAPVLRRVSEPAPTRSTEPVPPTTPTPPAPAVTVAGGDHLWSIAERTVAERLGRPATDAEVAPYWREVIDANRARLTSGDPDLLFPGERVVLP